MASHGVFRKLIFTSDVRFGDDEKYSNKCIFKQTRVGRGNYMLKSMETDVDSGHRGKTEGQLHFFQCFLEPLIRDVR